MDSMTGFGQGRRESELGALSIEVRGVNHRFLDVSMRLPQEFASFEPWARGEIQKRFPRGKITLGIQFNSVPGLTQRYEVNEEFLARLREMCAREDSSHSPAMETLLTIPGVVVALPDESREKELRRLFEQTLREALDAFAAERAREGEVLARALAEIEESMRRALAIIGEARGQVVDKYRQRLHERLEELLGPRGASLDPGRLEQEVALFADKADIAEEVVRLEAHLDHLRELTSQSGAIGRQLEFLNQEILRETNTIGSKCRDLEITRQVLDLKNLGENFREQIANIA